MDNPLRMVLVIPEFCACSVFLRFLKELVPHNFKNCNYIFVCVSDNSETFPLCPELSLALGNGEAKKQTEGLF